MAGQDGKRGGGRGGKPKGKHFGPSGRQSHGRGNKRKDMGRQEYFRNKDDWNSRNNESNNENSSKRLRLDENGTWTTDNRPFTREEIEAEDRRPKRKVAVLIGYSGTGYKGMQIMPDQPTIEGDLFKAMIKAGAISKANASDPKKNSLVRCARTDKGVHAAGNVISVKLIVEDEDVVQKINEHLPKQIRVWGIQRTVGSFSSYQACDSRWYEYLLPTHCFLPPHPSSFLGKKLVELAGEVGDLDGLKERQEEVEGWWAAAEEKFIKPVLDEIDEDIRADISQAMYKINGIAESAGKSFEESDDEASDDEEPRNQERPEGSSPVAQQPDLGSDSVEAGSRADAVDEVLGADSAAPSTAKSELALSEDRKRQMRVNEATKRLRHAYITAKTSYRLDVKRLERVKDALSQFVGTCNHHNYTVRKAPTDPSAKRHIKSFTPVRAPSSTTETGTYLIGDTEWLSIKVHGQSFMMHQIRKMIGMAALVVRAGARPSIIRESLSSEVVIAVPKAPSLGLLLERPVFESYNTHRAAQFDRDPITFDKFEEEMSRFKEAEIYQRIYDDEEREHVFHSFFTQIDEYKNDSFLYLTSKGFAAARGQRDISKLKVKKGLRHGRKKSPKGNRDGDAAIQDVDGDKEAAAAAAAAAEPCSPNDESSRSQEVTEQ